MAKNAKELVSRILNGESPREVIESATAEGVQNTSEDAMVTKKVVRNGKVVKKKFRRVKKHKVLSAAQKKAIRKAQKASKKNTAVRKRTKSLNKRKQFESEGSEPDFNVICPACASENIEVAQDEETGAIIFVCPDCGKEFSLVDNDILADLIGDEDDDDSDLEVDVEEFSDEEKDGFEPVDDEELGEGCGGPEDPDEPMYFEG